MKNKRIVAHIGLEGQIVSIRVYRTNGIHKHYTFGTRHYMIVLSALISGFYKVQFTIA